MASQSQAGGGGGGVGGSGSAGAAQRGQMQSLSRQGSLYDLTEVQSHLGEHLRSMNLDELQKSLLPDGLHPDGGTTTSQYEQSSGLLQQGSITMPTEIREKTVDEVWKDFHDELERNVGEGGGQTQGLEQLSTFGDMTLHELLLRAEEGQLLDQYKQLVYRAFKLHQEGRHSLPGAYMPGQLALQALSAGPGAILGSHSDGHITSPMMGEPQHSMNLEELQKSVFPDALDPDGGTTSQLYEQSSGLLREESITMPPVLSKRTVDEVWKDMQDAPERSVGERPGWKPEPEWPTLEEDMTLEDFLVRAGVVTKGCPKDNMTLEYFLVRAGVVTEGCPKDIKGKDINDRVNSLDDLLHDVTAEPIHVQLAVLQDITKNFSEERKIGQGGFGIVYKGVLQTGCVAVKKLLNCQTIEEEPFKREATFLMGVRHKNIVRFLGYCANTEHRFIKMEGSGSRSKPIYSEIRERLLCFEYMSNGGLDTHLTDELRGLEWHTRYQIIKGICEGLKYLHKKNIVHMDLKPANILLDDYMEPKITDFGISRYLDGVSRYVTKQRLISLGYSAPEYANRGEVSFKADIFSLGAIITEIVTGRKQDTDSKNVLRRWRHRWNRSGKYPQLGYQHISKCIEIARSCMVENPKLRPYIWEINIGHNEEEKANNNITAAESIDGQISPYPWELFEIDPLELNFLFKPNKQIQCSVELNNVRDNYIAFQIEKPSILNYLVEPDKGVMPPHSRSSVTVTLQASNTAPDGMLCKENFVVRCAIVDDGLTAADINEDLFDTKLGKVVDEVMLTVAFT